MFISTELDKKCQRPSSLSQTSPAPAARIPVIEISFQINKTILNELNPHGRFEFQTDRPADKRKEPKRIS